MSGTWPRTTNLARSGPLNRGLQGHHIQIHLLHKGQGVPIYAAAESHQRANKMGVKIDTSTLEASHFPTMYKPQETADLVLQHA